MRYKTYSGMLLKQVPYKESDLVVTFWSYEEGKIRLLVKGIKKPVSRLRGLLVPFAWLNIEAVSGSHWPVVTGVKLLRRHDRIAQDLRSLAAVFNIQEMILRTTGDTMPSSDITSLLKQSLLHFEKASWQDREFLNIFRFKLLTALGYELQFSGCTQCGKSKDEWTDLSLSAVSGGVVCGDCSRDFFDAAAADLRTVEYLDKMQKADFGYAEGQTEADTKNQAEKFLNDFFFLLVERKMKSQNFIEQSLGN